METAVLFTKASALELGFWLFIFVTFSFSIFRTTFRRKYILDFWSYTLVLQIFIPFILQFWFAGSIVNIISVGKAVLLVQESLPKAFLISCTGIASLFLGAAISSHPLVWPIRVPISIATNRIYTIFSDPGKGRIYAALMLGLSALISGYVISKIGFGFKARDSSLQDNGFRPLLNLNLAFLLPVSTLILSARALAFRKPVDVFLGVIALPLIAITGTKSAALSPIMSLVILYTATSRVSIGRASLLAGGFVSFVLLIPLLNALRQGSGTTDPLVEFFYGNAFSDLRDFAWFLAYWKGEYFLGLTYLAGFMSFLPRALSPFREQYAYGVVTATTVGFSPLSHAGLRIGIFGEPFINFGWVGVIIAGLFMGVSIRYLHQWVCRSEDASERIIRFSVAIYVSDQVFKIGNSSAFFALYGFLALLVGNELFCVVTKKLRREGAK